MTLTPHPALVAAIDELIGATMRFQDALAPMSAACDDIITGLTELKAGDVSTATLTRAIKAIDVLATVDYADIGAEIGKKANAVERELARLS